MNDRRPLARRHREEVYDVMHTVLQDRVPQLGEDGKPAKGKNGKPKYTTVRFTLRDLLHSNYVSMLRERDEENRFTNAAVEATKLGFMYLYGRPGRGERGRDEPGTTLDDLRPIWDGLRKYGLVDGEHPTAKGAKIPVCIAPSEDHSGTRAGSNGSASSPSAAR